MHHDFTVSGPLQVRARVRSADLVLTTSEPGTASVRLQSSRDAAERGSFAAGTLVELVGDVLIVESRQPRSFSRKQTRIHVAVPAGSSLHADTGAGDITGTVPLTVAKVRAGSGDTDLTDVEDAVVTAGSGDVRIASLGTGRVTTGSGDAAIGTVADSLHLRTGSGDGAVGSAARLTATTGSGSLVVERVDGELSASGAQGDVSVWRAEQGVLSIRSTSGDVTVGVPRGTAALMDVATQSGRIRSALEACERAADDERRLELHLHTTSGDIELRRA